MQVRQALIIQFFLHYSNMKGRLIGQIVYYVALLVCLVVFIVGNYERWQCVMSLPVLLPLVLSVLCVGAAGLCLWRRAPLILSPWVLFLLTALAAGYVYGGNMSAFGSACELPVAVLLTMGTLCLLWALLRWGSLIIWLPFFFLQVMQYVGYEQYGTRLNSLVVAETLEASAEEYAAYLSGGNIWIVIGAVLGLAVIGTLHVLILRRVKSRLCLLFNGLIFGLLGVLLAGTVAEHRQSSDHFWPIVASYELGEAFSEALYHNQATVQLVEDLHSPAEHPSSIRTLKGGEGVVLVLHIGESVRQDRMSLNGYEKDTTPWLCSQRARLINFTDCISAAQDTCQAQIAIMTDARRNIYDTTPIMQPKTGSVLELFKANTFKIYSFFGRRVGQKLKYDRVVRLLTACSEERFNASGSPWTAVPQIEGVLKSVSDKQNMVLFINNEGSHTPFYHYDADNPPFTPSVRSFDDPSEHAEEVNNAYDNTIHYTDEYIRRVAELLRGRPFIYLYVSDHGEFLGHDGIWGRAALGESKYSYHDTDGCRVGMFVLTSPEFDALHPDFAAALERMRSRAQMTVGHEHIFHTLLGLFGISTQFYDPALDLTSPQVQPYTGPMPAVQK